MNVYLVHKCKKCGEVDADVETVMVHGADYLGSVVRMLRSGQSVRDVRKKVCGHCGGIFPCGCPNSYPQAE